MRLDTNAARLGPNVTVPGQWARAGVGCRWTRQHLSKACTTKTWLRSQTASAIVREPKLRDRVTRNTLSVLMQPRRAQDSYICDLERLRQGFPMGSRLLIHRAPQPASKRKAKSTMRRDARRPCCFTAEIGRRACNLQAPTTRRQSTAAPACGSGALTASDSGG